MNYIVLKNFIGFHIFDRNTKLILLKEKVELYFTGFC